MSKPLKVSLVFIALSSLIILLFPFKVPWAQNGTTPAALLDFSQTGAKLTTKLMVNDQLITTPNPQTIASDTINLSADIKIDENDVGQEGAIYVVMLWNGSFFMAKDENGNWQPWDGELEHLAVYQILEQLPEMKTIEVISGLGGLTGEFAFYLGYKNSQTGNLIYNSLNPIIFTVGSIQQVLSSSLHATTAGMKHFYMAEQGGFEQFTHLPYEELTCQSCHVESSDCTTCHEVPGDTPENAKCLDSCHDRQNLEQQISPDLHLADPAEGGLGMKCADCHSAKQIHGDGTSYNSLHENLTKVDCQQSGCHSQVVIAGKTMHETHIKDIDCAACHTKVTMTCYSCHFEDGSAFQPPISDWKILVKSQKSNKVTTGNIQPLVYQGNSLLVVAPFFAHTIQKHSDTTCSTCHDSTALQEYEDKGTMTMTTWDETNKTINNMKGVIPIPTDWKTALKMDFIGKDANGEWVYQKSTVDAHQMLFAEPIDVEHMPKF